MNAICDQCGRPVIKRPDGKTLDVQPHRLGINRPDAGQLTPSQIARAFHGTGPLAGHIAHHCNPIEQEALFDIVMPPTRTRGR